MDSNTYNDTVKEYLKRYYGRTPNTAGTFRYLEGGLNTQTGYAYLDGTTQKPERILPSNVTRTFDDFVYRQLPRFSNVFSGLNGKTSNTSNATNVHNEITMNNSVPSDWSEKNALDNVERMITGAMRKAGINP